VAVTRGSIDAQAIRAAALALFAERGYRATGMADIGAALGIRGPSLYRHVQSKHALLRDIMLATMRVLIAEQAAALEAGDDVVVQVRRMVEAHVRFHAGHREEAFVGNRELDNLEPDARAEVLALRARYEHTLRETIERGCALGRFQVTEPRLASYAILDMGIGVAVWFRANGPYSVNQVAYAYAELATRLLDTP
jgi:AcrR family transcriptional regulator